MVVPDGAWRLARKGNVVPPLVSQQMERLDVSFRWKGEGDSITESQYGGTNNNQLDQLREGNKRGGGGLLTLGGM